ncbi:MAG: TonB-dependent receptor plug domain-containing protein [Pseudobdellovibrionaceae bacterium]
MKPIHFSFILLSLCSLQVAAQEAESTTAQSETVIQDSSFNSTSKVILDEVAIRKSRAPNVTTLLATQANIAVSTSNLQPGSIYLRGGDSGHILIVIDGLPFYDASTTQRTMNLNEIDIKSIRKIEIIKGSQSVWYGGQALTGVIKIDTLPLDMDKKSSAAVEGGMLNYKKLSLFGLQPIGEQDALLARVQGSEKDNRSPVLESSESYRNRLLSGEVTYLHRGESDLFFKASQINDRSQITNTHFEYSIPMYTNYSAIDAKNFVSEVDIKSVAAGWVQKNSPMRPKLLASYQIADRSFIEREPTPPQSASDDQYGSGLLNARFESTLIDQDEWQVLMGLSYQKEQFLNRSYGVETVSALTEQKGIFAKSNWTLGTGVLLEAGVRTEFYRKADHAETYQAGLSFFDMLKFEYSTGFKAPSLFQLNSPSYGNADLQPEKAQTYTVSFEERIGDQQALSVSLFETHFSSLITTQRVSGLTKFYNVSRAITRGSEVQYSYQTLSKLRADVSVGYQEPWDVDAAQWLVRRPLQTGSLRLTQTWENADLGYEVIAVGERLDRFKQTFPPGPMITSFGNLDSYVISNVFASFQMNESSSVYTRGSNIFGQRYEESRGYHNEGAFWLVGLELRN